jgi:dienelactone hydrolase
MEKKLHYNDGTTRCSGFLAYDDKNSEKRPAVIIAHAWRGLDTFAKDKARALAAMGYLALAADLYGDGIEAHTDEEASQLMLPLFLDRHALQQRLIAAFNAVTAEPLCDTNKVCAMGFCFGGLAVVELLRSGTPICGTVSFHGTLRSAMDGQQAQTVPLAADISASLLLLHGHDDPLMSSGDLKAVLDEMTTAHIDWQLHSYGNTVHAFTNPHAHSVSQGLVYNPLSAKRSWQAMDNFFHEIFNRKAL